MEEIFAYNDEPLDVLDSGAEEINGVRVHDISYTALKDVRVSAYLVVPMAKPPFAGIIFLHGAGQSRVDFLTEAMSLARSGALSLLLDNPLARSVPNFIDPKHDRSQFIKTVIASRRGVDLLIARGDVRPDRLGCVAISLGAWFAGILAGIEKRLQTYVLMAGAPGIRALWDSTTHPIAIQARRTLSKTQLDLYQKLIDPLDATRYINGASPSSLLFQFARCDALVSRQVALGYYRAASEPKAIKWYDIGHPEMSYNVPAQRDRFQWLSEQLQIEIF